MYFEESFMWRSPYNASHWLMLVFIKIQFEQIDIVKKVKKIPNVSILTPNYNDLTWQGWKGKSNYAHISLIAVNNGSSNCSQNYVLLVQGQPSFRYLHFKWSCLLLKCQFYRVLFQTMGFTKYIEKCMSTILSW